MSASVFKPTYTRPIPEGATITTKRGIKVAKFKRGGRTVEAPLTKDGTRCRVETAEWYVRYKDAAGKWQREKGYTDRAATETLAVQIRSRIAREQQGVADPFEKHHKRLLADHLVDFKRELEARNNTTDHVKRSVACVRKIIEACRFKRIKDISASAIQAHLADKRAAGLGPVTSNTYLQCIKQFSRWLMYDRRTNEDVLVHLQLLNTHADRRHDRRALTAEELPRLIEAAESAPSARGVTGPDRAMIYLMAVWTGCRRRELASLTLQSFDLDSETPSVCLLAACTKNRRTDTIPLHSTLVERLRAWLATKGKIDPDAPLFPLRFGPGGAYRATNVMVQGDLERARTKWIEEATDNEERGRRQQSDFLRYCDSDGLYADFHSFRHTFISNLGKAGVPLLMAQKLARHSDPKLTANVYTHIGISDKQAAIESLPALPGAKPDEPEGRELRATGTEGKPEPVIHRLGGKRKPSR